MGIIIKRKDIILDDITYDISDMIKSQVSVNIGGGPDIGVTTGNPATPGDWTTIPFDTEDYDNLSEWNTTTSRFVPANNGYYSVKLVTKFLGVDANTYILQAIRVDGTYVYRQQYVSAAAGTDYSFLLEADLYLQTTEYLDFGAITVGSNEFIEADATDSYAMIHRFA